MFDEAERDYVETARIGRLATADADGRPHAVPVCFAVLEDHIVTAIDEKPQDVAPDSLRRCQDIAENPHVILLVDHYTEDWSRLGWIQVRGTATMQNPGDGPHERGIRVLRAKYEQYGSHALEHRPLIEIDPGSVRSWGALDRPHETN